MLYIYFTLDEHKVQSNLCMTPINIGFNTLQWYKLWLLSGKILAVKSSHDSDSPSSAIAESDKVLIPQDHDNSASLTDQLETPVITSVDAPVLFSYLTSNLII